MLRADFPTAKGLLDQITRLADGHPEADMQILALCCAGTSEVYGWFTEGFETGDLKEARTLLQELG